FHTVEADFFADCSGDSILAPLTGAEFRIGREAKKEFGESLAQDEPDNKTMGMSCIMQLRETDSPKKFIPPSWAYKYPTDDCFPKRGHLIKWFLNFWYLEYGGDQDSIKDTEEIRDDLLKTALGMWDHMKNQGDHQADNWILDWLGFLPGKRESRRCIGDHLLTQHDVLNGGNFEDIVAFGGWPVDDHHPAGFRYFGPPNMVIEPGKSYGIPLRCLYSKNVPNLLFAGRNISATHTGLSSTRVMATCATLGQAAGTAAIYAIKGNCPDVRTAAQKYIHDIQQTLLDDDCYLLHLKREVSPITRNAKLTVSNGNAELLRNGFDRPDETCDNAWHIKSGDWAEYEAPEGEEFREVRLIFDSNLKRNHLNMVANYPIKGEVYTPPVELVQGFHLEADGKEIFRTDNNYQRLVKIKLDTPARKVKLVIDTLRQDNDDARMFSFEAR
ncbi:MAG: FAD-dependent oxidoreductase, partial [Lentisphaeria bacterium]|nr:FAD-dependent oxidoreductase [Lentisphaeria bacterium]